MSTLARDFAAESGMSRIDHEMESARWWIRNYGKLWFPAGGAEQAEADIREALESDPDMTYWCPWPEVLAKGRWLRGRRSQCSL
jgi:hypothetical protein